MFLKKSACRRKHQERLPFDENKKNARPRLTKSQCREGRKTAVPPSFAEVCFHTTSALLTRLVSIRTPLLSLAQAGFATAVSQ